MLNFATASPQAAIAVNTNGVYWANTGTTTIGHANIDGSAPKSDPDQCRPGSIDLRDRGGPTSFVYWLNNVIGPRIGRAGADGSSPTPSFIGGVTGPAAAWRANSAFLY